MQGEVVRQDFLALPVFHLEHFIHHQVVLVLAALAVVLLVLVVMEPQIEEVVVGAAQVLLLPLLIQVAQAALALSSLKYLTTYPQHSLVELHLACPHLSLGSTSTL
jgi:hypothetical protein